MIRHLSWLAVVACLAGCEHGPDVVRPDDPFRGDRSPVNGSGNVVTESRAVQTFHRVALSGVGHLVLEQTGSPSLTIVADDNIVPLLVSRVTDGTLELGVSPDTNLGSVHTIEFRVTAPALDELRATGAATVDARNVETGRLDVAVTGATSISIAGRAAEQNVTITGASTYSAGGLESRIVSVDATGASSVIVRVEDTLTARVRGGSTVAFIGNPTVHVDGSPENVHPK